MRPAPPDGATRFVPLPELVPKSAASTEERWRAAARPTENHAADELYKLAQRAAKSKPTCYALASVCLRDVIEREPDHREARRLLGYVPHDGGWATPYAVGKLHAGYVSHPTFGWVAADWVPHLDLGELPAPPARGQKKTQWLPAAEADKLRATWNPPWHIFTEHFEIQTDVTLAEVIGFGRRLEAFYDVFITLFADVIGDRLPLARRFKAPAANSESDYKPHSIYYFGSRTEYIDHLSPHKGPEIAESLGFFDTPPLGSSRRSRAYFFRDPDGELPVTSNLYHEVSHQLLFEMAGANAYTKNTGNYWVFEGLGTYFETVSPQPDGTLEVGGMVGRRFEEAVKALVGQGRVVPIAEFLEMDQNAFNRRDVIRFHYKQAMALAIFLMQWHNGVYRDAFLDYVNDAYRGRIKRGSGRTLQDRLGQTYATLDKQFLAFLKDAHARLNGPTPDEAKPNAAPAFRTVQPPAR